MKIYISLLYFSKGQELAISVRERDRDEGHGRRLTENCYSDTFVNHVESLDLGSNVFDFLTKGFQTYYDFTVKHFRHYITNVTAINMMVSYIIILYLWNSLWMCCIVGSIKDAVFLKYGEAEAKREAER